MAKKNRNPTSGWHGNKYYGSSVAAADRGLSQRVNSKPISYYTMDNGTNLMTDYPGFADGIMHQLPSGNGGGGGGGGRRNGRGGYGGGGGGGRRSLNLKIYKRGRYDSSGVMRNANTLANQYINDTVNASNIGRNSARTNYGNTARELGYSQARDVAQNRANYTQAQSEGANVALNRGMGYGQGYLQTQANTNTAYQKMLEDVNNGYAMQLANALDSLNSQLYGYDQTDANARQARAAKYIEFLSSLGSDAFNQYLGVEGLRQKEIDSQNAHIAAL